MPRLKRPRKRRPRQLQLFEKPAPGDSVQVDVKMVTIAGRKAYQYTALDDCTRYRVLRLYPRLSHPRGRFIPSGTGVSPRSISSFLSDILSIRDRARDLGSGGF